MPEQRDAIVAARFQICDGLKSLDSRCGDRLLYVNQDGVLIPTLRSSVPSHGDFMTPSRACNIGVP